MQSDLYLYEKTSDPSVDYVLEQLVEQGYVNQEECDYEYEGLFNVKGFKIYKCYSEMLKSKQIVTRCKDVTQEVASAFDSEYIDATGELIIFGTGFSASDQIKGKIAELENCEVVYIRLKRISAL